MDVAYVTVLSQRPLYLVLELSIPLHLYFLFPGCPHVYDNQLAALFLWFYLCVSSTHSMTRPSPYPVLNCDCNIFIFCLFPGL